MSVITVQDLALDLSGWFKNQGPVVNAARNLSGGRGGWEQWSLIDFLLWQTTRHPGGRFDLAYEREYSQIGSRRFDLAYNTTGMDQNHPLMLTQWKCLNDSNTAISGAFLDIGTLQEANNILAGYNVSWRPVPVVICPAGAPINLSDMYPIVNFGTMVVLTATNSLLAKFNLPH